MDNSQVVWVAQGESSTSAVPQLDLQFNYKINPDDLRQKLKVEVDGQNAPFDFITMSPDNKMSVRITGLKCRIRIMKRK
ncbi:MAG: hypothetical protein WDO16_06380 [Bacteroidota bacterium]